MSPSKKTGRGDRRKAYGQDGESAAAAYLRRHGYRIIERGYRCRLGEIDIIAVKDEYLVFCEVKTRSNSAYGRPFEAVNRRKQDKLRRLASYYFALVSDRTRTCRFDVISVETQGGDITINHLKNAFN